jgi:phage I-like protein
MTEYNVVWRIDIETGTPEQAAKLARDIQLDPESTATNFQIRRPGVSWLAEIDVAENKPVHFTNTAEQETYEDLLSRVHSLLHGMAVNVDSKILTLVLSGSGVLEAHQAVEGQAYLEPMKVVLALLKDMEDQQQPLIHLNTKKFKADVNNYYLLM